jgi:hypothetical protein
MYDLSCNLLHVHSMESFMSIRQYLDARSNRSVVLKLRPYSTTTTTQTPAQRNLVQLMVLEDDRPAAEERTDSAGKNLTGAPGVPGIYGASGATGHGISLKKPPGLSKANSKK